MKAIQFLKLMYWKKFFILKIEKQFDLAFIKKSQNKMPILINLLDEQKHRKMFWCDFSTEQKYEKQKHEKKAID